MRTSYLYMVLGLLSFAAMGIVHKIGDRFEAQPLPIALYALISAGVLSVLRVLWMHDVSTSSLPPHILLIAIPFGGFAGLALWCFQKGLRYGSIATSWLVINLSAGIPTVLSVLFYREVIGLKKTIVLGLVIFSLLLLWWDRRSGNKERKPASSTFTAEIV